MKTKTFKTDIESKEFETNLSRLYGPQNVKKQQDRYLKIFKRFCDKFPLVTQFDIFSASGRIEVIGNHTDHQLGHVLAMSVDLDTVAFAFKNDENIIRFYSKDYLIEPIHLEDLSIQTKERYTTMGLIRGLANYFKELQGHVGGFNAYVESDVLSGSGLSSSASVEVLIAKILDTYYGNSKLSVSDYAVIAQKAENNYFDKPCGLMDQMVIAHGGFCAIDFNDSLNPKITKVTAHGLFDAMDICLIQTGGSHANLSADYAEIFTDCKTISKAFHKDVLSLVNEIDFYTDLNTLYAQFDTRAILRAHHFFSEDKRVLELAKAIDDNQIDTFLKLIIESGRSSALYLQNTWNKHSNQQGLSLALMMAEKNLQGHGAWRVHGGGFAGTVLLFVPKTQTAELKLRYQKIFGDDGFIIVRMREDGVYHLA